MDNRRRHFRLAAHLPLDIVVPVESGRRLRRVSSNLSAGGVYFHGHPDDGVVPGQKINLRIAVPPGVGRSAQEKILEGEATVLRVDLVTEPKTAMDAVGVACAFDSPLRFS